MLDGPEKTLEEYLELFSNMKEISSNTPDTESERQEVRTKSKKNNT